jgi:hypothetical protein
MKLSNLSSKSFKKKYFKNGVPFISARGLGNPLKIP